LQRKATVRSISGALFLCEIESGQGGQYLYKGEKTRPAILSKSAHFRPKIGDKVLLKEGDNGFDYIVALLD